MPISPEVSVIVVTYNQELDRLIKTLESIIVQQNISFEIIVCDDGSEVKFENEIKTYFSTENFFNYKLIFHDCNEGTVSNYYSGLKEAKGKYSKLLSPGDYLAGKKTLYNWVQFMKEKKVKWSFADAKYYKNMGGDRVFFKANAKPQIIKPYYENDLAKCAWNYIVLHDIANGAAIIGTTNEQKKFCKIIKDKGIKYCEDYIYRLMMFYGNIGGFFPEPAICYEYGSGVSTSGSSLWRTRIFSDREKLVQILHEEKGVSCFQSEIVNGLIRNIKANKMNKIFIRGNLFLWMKRRFFPRLTKIPDEVGE